MIIPPQQQQQQQQRYNIKTPHIQSHINSWISNKNEIRYYDIVIISKSEGGRVVLPSSPRHRQFPLWAPLTSLAPRLSFSPTRKGGGGVQVQQPYVWLQARYYNKQEDIYWKVPPKIINKVKTRKWYCNIIVISVY